MTGRASRGRQAGQAAGNGWPPRALRDYAFLADGERGALIGPDGAIVWLCVPRWDSPPVFAALVGGGGGFSVSPADPWHVWGGYYEPGSLIWHSRWVGDAVTECREALARPADPDCAVLLRQIHARDGRARVNMRLDLRGGSGRRPVRDLARSAGCWTGRSGRLWFRLSGAGRARPARDGQELALTLTLDPGERHDLVLEISSRKLTAPPPEPGVAWPATEAAWASAVPDCSSALSTSSRSESSSWLISSAATSAHRPFIPAAMARAASSRRVGSRSRRKCRRRPSRNVCLESSSRFE